MYSPAQEVPGTPQMCRRDKLQTDISSLDAVVPDDIDEDSADDSYSVPGTPVHRRQDNVVSTPGNPALNMTPSTITSSSRGNSMFRTPRPVLPSPLASSLKEQEVPSTPTRTPSGRETSCPRNRTPRTVRNSAQKTTSPLCKAEITEKKSRAPETVMDATGDHGPIIVDSPRSRGRREAVARFRRSPEVMSSGQSGRRNIMNSPDFLDDI